MSLVWHFLYFPVHKGNVTRFLKVQMQFGKEKFQLPSLRKLAKQKAIKHFSQVKQLPMCWDFYRKKHKADVSHWKCSALAAHLNIMLLQPSVIGEGDKIPCLCLRHKMCKSNILSHFFGLIFCCYVNVYNFKMYITKSLVIKIWNT